MVIVNLLSWRQDKKRYEHRRMTIVLSMIVIMMMTACSSLHFYLSALENTAALAVNSMLQTKAALMSSHNRLSSAPISQFVRETKNDISDINELIISLHDVSFYAMCISQISRTDEAMVIAGRARSPDELTAFLKEFRGARLFSQITIEQIEKNDAMNDWFFELRAYPVSKRNNAWIHQEKLVDDV